MPSAFQGKLYAGMLENCAFLRIITTEQKNTMNIIGRIDKVDFPELQLSNLAAKIDTGAFTSSIHSHEIQEDIQNGITIIKFKLLDPTHPEYKDIEYKVRKFSKKTIKSSFGTTEERYVIETVILLFGEEHTIELSLTERGNMKFPILLGRKLLNKKFIVDTSKKNISYKLKQKVKKTTK